MRYSFFLLPVLLLAALPVRAQTADSSLPPDDAPWYNIQYECRGGSEGIEILQTVEDEGADWLDIRVHLRFKDLDPTYHRNVFVDKFTSFDSGAREDWIALVGAGAPGRKGTTWTSPETVRIPRTWAFDNGKVSYTGTWDDERRRYRLSNWEDETPYDRHFEAELFGVHVECYRHDPEPEGQDDYQDNYDSVPTVIRL